MSINFLRTKILFFYVKIGIISRGAENVVLETIFLSITTQQMDQICYNSLQINKLMVVKVDLKNSLLYHVHVMQYFRNVYKKKKSITEKKSKIPTQFKLKRSKKLKRK